MSAQDPNLINSLIARFSELQANWERDPKNFDWAALRQLAREGASAYNEQGGRSFQALALDGVRHSEFHERFLADSMQAGFDPFKLGTTRSAMSAVAAIDHTSLAEAAETNSSAARMRAALMDAARARFSGLAQEVRNGKSGLSAEQLCTVEANAASIPPDLLQQIAPQLARAWQGSATESEPGPSEGYLSTAEKIVEDKARPYG